MGHKNQIKQTKSTNFISFLICWHAVVAYIANKMDPDQTAPKGAIWSGFIMFAFIMKKKTGVHLNILKDFRNTTLTFLYIFQKASLM